MSQLFLRMQRLRPATRGQHLIKTKALCPPCRFPVFYILTCTIELQSTRTAAVFRGRCDVNARPCSFTAFWARFLGEHLSLNHGIQPQTVLTQPWLSHPARPQFNIFTGQRNGQLKHHTKSYQGNDPANCWTQDATGSLRQHATYFSYYSNNRIS